MKKFLPIMSLALLLFAAFTVQAPPKKISVEGTLIDTKCYGMNHMNTGNDHMTPKGKMPNCATACAQMGIPVGVLEGGKKDGKVYVVIAPAGSLAEHMSKQVRLKGELAYEGGILPGKLEVKNADGKWEQVKLAGMM